MQVQNEILMIGTARYEYRMLEMKYYPHVRWDMNGLFFRETEYETPCEKPGEALVMAMVFLREEEKWMQGTLDAAKDQIRQMLNMNKGENTNG